MKEILGQSKKMKIKGADINFRVLEGKEETAYLDHTRIVLKLGKTAKQSFDLAFDPNKYSAEKKFKKRPKKNKLIFLILLS